MEIRRSGGPARSPWMLLALALVACDCDDGPPPPCERADAPMGCGSPCESTLTCRAGLYCGDEGRCTADCALAADCDTGQTCSSTGLCEPSTATDRDSSVTDRDGFVGVDGPAVDGTSGCPSATVSARQVTPTVIVIVDQSSSMDARFGDSNRWDALRDSLLDPSEGLIASLEDQVRFGLALYSAEAEGSSAGPPIGECPQLTEVQAMVSNYAAIRDAYQAAEPIDETPTGDSIDAVLDGWLATPDRPTDPTIFILATDGEPDRCEELNPQNGQAEAIASVERAHDAGIRTFVISVGSDVSMSHLQDVANAGLGLAAGGDADFWVAGDDAGLRDALTEIIGGELSCTVELDARLQDVSDACMGSVTLNGRELTCDDPDGWRVVDEDTIELQGDACDELKTSPGASLSATFPCGVVLI